MDANFGFRKTSLTLERKVLAWLPEGGSQMVLSAKQILFGSVLLLAGSPIFATETASSSGVAPTPHVYVNCPGISSVPMTADAEQALPLRQIATLACGQQVAVLADNEGYTAHIRTSDGKEGYVARMYLTTATLVYQPALEFDEPTPVGNATPVNGIVRWNAGETGCEQFASRGRQVESATANGITVQVSLQDTGWKLHASVAVSNGSNSQVLVLPALITLDELTPTLRNLREENPVKLARSEVNHQLMHNESNAVPPPSAIVLHKRSDTKVSPTTYRGTSVDDYLGHNDESASVRAVALKGANLAPSQKTSGELWFVRDSNAYELSLRISVGDLVFDFPFSFEQK
jgi:hypothetical protein